MEWKAVVTTVVLVLALTTPPILADTPANCTYDDIQGTWNLYETERSGDATIDCDNMGILFHLALLIFKYAQPYLWLDLGTGYIYFLYPLIQVP